MYFFVRVQYIEVELLKNNYNDSDCKKFVKKFVKLFESFNEFIMENMKFSMIFKYFSSFFKVCKSFYFSMEIFGKFLHLFCIEIFGVYKVFRRFNKFVIEKIEFSLICPQEIFQKLGSRPMEN